MRFDAAALRDLPAPRTWQTIDLSLIPPKPWPWPRSMTDAEITEYQALLGSEYRITRGFVTARGDQVYGEPVTAEPL